MPPKKWERITRFEGPETSPGFLLWQVSSLWRREIESALAPLGLTHPQFVLLASTGWLTREGEQVSQVELARFCGTDLTVTSQVLRTLERRGLITRLRCKGDQRSRLPQLTREGEALVRLGVPLVEEVDAAFFKCLKSQAGQWTEMLQQIVARNGMKPVKNGQKK